MDTELKPLLEKMAESNHRLEKMTSCLVDPQQTALESLKLRQIQEFADAVLDDDFVIDEVYGDNSKTLLLTAVEEGSGNDEFVALLIKRKAKADLENSVLETTPLHEAAAKGDPDLLKLVLLGVTDINVQNGEGSTALHVAAEALADADEEAVHNIVDSLGILLLTSGIEVNAEDLKGEATPLYYAALSGNAKAVELLLDFGADAQNDNSGEKIEDVITENIPEFDLKKINKVRKGRPIKNILFNMIELGDNAEGMKIYTSNRRDVDWNADNGQYTLLQYAADQGRDKIVKLLLERGAEPSKIGINSLPAWVIAAQHGYHKVLKIFFNYLSEDKIKQAMIMTDEAHGQRTILHEVVRQRSPKLENPRKDQNIDYEECLRILFDDKKLGKGKSSTLKYTQRIINFKDAFGETALHYATQQPNQEIIKLLLKNGANMGVLNNEMKAPVSRILPDTLGDFFDDCFKPEGLITDDDFKLTISYNFLAPPLTDDEILEEFEKRKPHDVEGDIDIKYARPETEPLWYMSIASKEHRALLKHPVVASFLWMKWQRMRSFYYVNLFIYALFVLFLTILIFLDYGGCSLVTPSSTDEVVITSSETANTETCTRIGTVSLKIVLAVFVIYLTIMELLQIAVSFKRYFVTPENFFEVWLLIMAAILIIDKNMTFEAKRHMAALTIIISWVELIIKISQHPSFSINVTMFYKVVATFVTFLLWYIPFIVAFAFSFYIMFHTDYKGGDFFVNPKNVSYPFFDNVGTCFVKTVAMFIGELEFSDIPFTENALSYIIFIAFIFFIVVVLMNLLNGLAVSDTGLIREEAEVLSLKSQVDFISYSESILLNDPYNFLSNWPKLFAELPSCSCFSIFKRVPGCESFLSKVTGGTKILLFYECLPDKTATFLPNKNKHRSCIPHRRRIRAEAPGKGVVTGLEVSKEVLENAKYIILQKKKDAEAEVKNNKLAEQVKELTQKIDLILQRMEK